jgi:hypothetical protein
MLDSKQVKGLGLQFTRAMQIAVKTAAVFPVEHKSSERPILQSFEFLTSVLKAAGPFTFGFIDKEVMLNKVLTSDPSLRPLETEFTKRGLAALTFDPEITLASYKKLIYLFAAPSPNVDAAGGFLPYLNQNPIDSLHILPAKKQNKDEQGDTIIETDSESYILARQRGEHKPADDFLESIDALLESGCFDPASRAETLANLASGTMQDGYGVPLEIPKLAVVKDDETVVPAGSTSGTGTAGPNSAPHETQGTGFAGTGSAATPGNQVNISSQGGSLGYGRAGGFTAGDSGSLSVATSGGTAAAPVRAAILNSVPAPAAPGRRTGISSPDSFLELVEQSVQRSLAQENGNPEKSLVSLARLLKNTGVDRILQRFPAERHEELRQMKPEQLAAEFVEDTALQLAGSTLRSAEGSDQLAVEEDALQVLSRTLQATHMADRLAAKLAKFIKDFAIPPHVQEKIREELQWTTYPLNKKFARLLELPRYSNLEFRRFMELAKELLAQRDRDRVGVLINHYFEFLDAPDARIESTDLSRVPEIVQAFSSAAEGFAGKTSERLIRVLNRADISEFIHFQAASGLGVLGQSLTAQEQFREVLSIGVALEKSYNLDRERHKKCCGMALATLVPANAIERILDSHLQKRGESASVRSTATLLRFAAPGSIQNVMERLVNESDARNRLALVRLAGQLGTASIEVAVKYLADERWYVVRNMCVVLTELRDPHLADHLAPALRHADARVQQSALKAITKGGGAKTAQMLADSLPALAPQVLDDALDQLLYLRSQSTIAALEDFASSRRCNVVRAIKAIQALGAVPDPAALYALGRLFRIEELDPAVRRAALTAVSSQPSAAATQLLQELSAIWGPLAEEARNELAKRSPKQN